MITSRGTIPPACLHRPPRGCADSTCSNGIPGIEGTGSGGETACCLLTCIDEDGNPKCGGSGCKSREGGPAGCCIGEINREGDDCDDSGEAPCFIGERLTQSGISCLAWASRWAIGFQSESNSFLSQCAHDESALLRPLLPR